MKKIVSFVSIMLLIVSVACARDRVTQDVSVLPTEARDMIKIHFPKSMISYLKVDKPLFRTEGYEVRLSDGTELEFNTKGQWTEVECHPLSVPSGIIPESIRKYFGRYYGDQKVTKIKHNRRGYELKLSNGLEVEFDNMGNFLRLDD